MKNKIVIIWDWNGTIVDDASVFVKIMNFFLKEKKLPLININQYRNLFEFPLINYYSKLGFDFKEEGFESLGGRFIEQYKKHRFSASLFPKIRHTLAWLDDYGCSQFVVSAQEHSLLSSAIKYYSLSDFFVAYYGVDNVLALNKLELAKKLKKKFITSGDRVFVIGDTLHDLEVAKSIGAVSVLVSFGHYSRKRLINHGAFVCSSVEELKKILINQFC